MTNKPDKSVGHHPMGMAMVAVVGMGWALAAGYLEVGIIQFQRLVLGQLAYESSDVIWMAPISYASFAVAPVLLLCAAVLVKPSLITRRRVVFVFTMLVAMALTWLLLGARLHLLAHAVLGAGVAHIVAGLRVIRSGRFDRVAMRATAGLAVITALLAIAMPGSRALAEKTRVARLPAAERSAPNVLMIIWDTARRQNLSLYGYDGPTTPKLDEWAKRGGRFRARIEHIIMDAAITCQHVHRSSHAGDVYRLAHAA